MSSDMREEEVCMQSVKRSTSMNNNRNRSGIRDARLKETASKHSITRPMTKDPLRGKIAMRGFVKDCEMGFGKRLLQQNM